MQKNNKRLAVGAVQFGMPYGIANTIGQVSVNEAQKIIHKARSDGLDTLDTAITYGDSEHVLGEIGVSQWNVITKLPSIPTDIESVNSWITDNIKSSFERLRIKKINALLLHNSKDLLSENGQYLYDKLLELKEEGLVEKIGVSIYSPDELVEIINNYKIDIVQSPFNILDRRLLDSGWLARLFENGVEVHTRSVFLQGLLLMKKEDRPDKFSLWKEIWQSWDSWLSENNLNPVSACLQFAMARPEINRVVVGVDSLKHFNEIIDSLEDELPEIPESIKSTDIKLINPSYW